MSLIKKALALIDNRLTKVSETNAMYTLSDGSKVNKKEFNKRITVLNEFITHGVEMDEEILALMNLVERRKSQRTVQLIATEKALEREVEVLQMYETPCAPYVKDDVEKPKVISMQSLEIPTGSNKRFICGFTTANDDEEFVMVFWNNYKEVANSHGDLEEYYKKHHDAYFQASAGGFFLTAHHNNAVYREEGKLTNVYLFGKSSTFRSFHLERNDIRQYGLDRGFNFILGQTQFETGEYNDIIKDNFVDHRGEKEWNKAEREWTDEEQG